MTALKPIENLRVRGVASERYPVNEKCAHPECNEPATVHHIFARSLIKSDSYFVAIEDEGGTTVVPHAVGLCGSGTTGHHGDVEEHRAWIKLEDGEYKWYVHGEDETGAWDCLGLLNPQPGSREGKAKRKKFKGEARKQRRTLSIKVPDDAAENGAGIWDELVEQLRERYETPDMPVYHVAVRAFYEALTS